MPRRRRDADLIADQPRPGAAASSNASSPPPPPRKRAHCFKTPLALVDAFVHRSYKPRVKHRNHPDPGVGENFHSVPYPLSLMPYSSWHVLHHRRDPSVTAHCFACPACRSRRSFPSPHTQKLFLVAERLSWEDGAVPTAERELNQELTWEVNFQLGIEDPVIEQVPGGNNSRRNQWHPFANEIDCAAAMKLIARADCLTEKSYAMWSKMLDTLYTILPGDDADGPSASESSHSQSLPEPVDKVIDSHLPTPPSSSQPFASQMSQAPYSNEHSLSLHLDHLPPTPASSNRASFASDRALFEAPTKPIARSLPGFYSLLDTIERTSYVGAQYLEAYAEHLRDDLCEDCWWTHNISLNDAVPD
ncbi:hypothetical protein GTA08_BOTSDO03731 [Botryosphaeria dothidea]|uniref:Uncharacterized protein n=1 Tax=Botryosphaeria dothidea TaxID=55169 RepID=A0A8H4N9K3_9PEZI|nr:hypothetical protein GTA08_BOTSDO03731 [Botryosphaeria dothidea]